MSARLRLSVIMLGVSIPMLAVAADPGLATGWGHMVRVTSNHFSGLEATIPRKSSYARGIELDRKGRHQEAYRAFNRARSEFRLMLRNRPQDAARIRGWIAKAKQQAK